MSLKLQLIALEEGSVLTAKPQISVVVPVYNTKAYLRRCVDSLLKQSFQDLEIILVDDGSKDGSGELADELCLLDQRIRCVHQKNAGLSAARNTGVAHATGDFIGFVDSDDWCEPQMYERLYKLIRDHEGVDLAICGVKDQYPHKAEVPAALPDRIMSPEEVFEDICLNKTLMVGIPPRLYPRWLMQEVSSPVGYAHEDAYMLLDLLMRLKSVAVCTDPLYVYFHNSSSITSASYGKASLDNIVAWERVQEQLKTWRSQEEWPSLHEALKFRVFWAYFAALDDMVLAKQAQVDPADKNKVISYLLSHKQEILAHPAVSRARKLAIRALSCGLIFYRLLVILQARRQRLY